MHWWNTLWQDVWDAFASPPEIRGVREQLQQVRAELSEALAANDALNATIDKLRDRLRKISAGNQKLAFVAEGTLKDAGLDSDG